MNILPFIFLLLLLLSALSVKQLELFKNNSIREKELETWAQFTDRELLNERQLQIYNGDAYYKTRKLNIRPFIDPKYRSSNGLLLEQLQKVLMELMRVLYQEAKFFKEMEEKRPNFLEELTQQILSQSEKQKSILEGRIENLSKLVLDDPDLQNAFYKILKGTTSRTLTKEYAHISPTHAEKSYPSLLNFLTKTSPSGSGSPPEQIPLFSAPKELLLAIYQDEESVNNILALRKEFRPKKTSDKVKNTKSFKEAVEHFPKKPGIDNSILSFKVSTTNPSIYD